jgi:hypothetical protein
MIDYIVAVLESLKDLQLSVIELKDAIIILSEQLQKPSKRGRSATRSNAFGSVYFVTSFFSSTSPLPSFLFSFIL